MADAKKKSAKGGKKNRKHGRNKVFCEKYRSENRRARNKERKRIRHEKRMAK